MRLLKTGTQSVLLLVIFAAWLGSGCKGSSEKEQPGTSAGEAAPSLALPGSGAVVDNRSQIAATVVEVVPLKAPRFRLRLHVEKADSIPGYASLARPGEEIDVYPNFVRREGKAIDPGSEENRHMLQARQLQPGEKITAVVYRRGNGPEGSWLMMSWQRR